MCVSVHLCVCVFVLGLLLHIDYQNTYSPSKETFLRSEDILAVPHGPRGPHGFKSLLEG